MSDWVTQDLGCMAEADYRELEPLYEQAKQEVPLMNHIGVSAIQRKYRLGYNRAARLLEQLCAAGVLEWNRITGAYRRAQNGDSR